MKNEELRKIKLTKKELNWIERTADIESAIAMNRFTSLVNSTDLAKLTEEEVKMVKNISSELIELYLFLRELRTKLELWDCRYGIDSEIEVLDKK